MLPLPEWFKKLFTQSPHAPVQALAPVELPVAGERLMGKFLVADSAIEATLRVEQGLLYLDVFQMKTPSGIKTVAVGMNPRAGRGLALAIWRGAKEAETQRSEPCTLN